jgi:hypothetical protein
MPRPKRRASASQRTNSDFYYGEELDGALDVDLEEEADAELLQDNEDDDGCVSSLFDGGGDDDERAPAAAAAAAAAAGAAHAAGDANDNDDDENAAEQDDENAAEQPAPPAVGAYDDLKIDALKRECTLCAVRELCRYRCAACSAHLCFQVVDEGSARTAPRPH